MYKNFSTLFNDVAVSVRPIERLTVAQAAEKYRFISNAGSYVGYWDNSMAPYLVEPMEALTSLDYTSMIFAGPARCGKTDLLYNWLLYTQVSDPADIMVVQMTRSVARDWSIRQLQRMLRLCPVMHDKVLGGLNSMNVQEVRFTSGTDILIRWPTVSELSGKTIPRNWISDYDRLAPDIDGEGSAFELTKKRAQTFGRYGMTVAESSPGFDMTDPNWSPTSSHEAPPTGGILALYNRGDRRRFYWFCQKCGQPFEGDFKYLSYPDCSDPVEAGEMATMNCPFCGFAHTFTPSKNGGDGRKALNANGMWVKGGQIVRADRSVVGEPIASNTASFWLKGPAALFMTWAEIVTKYLQAKSEYDLTGDDASLRTTTNVDQGLPYLSVAIRAERTPESLKAASKPYQKRKIPAGVRFLVACIDVQGNRFEVQIHGICENFNVVIIDRYALRYSNRRDPDRRDQFLSLEPAAYLEDWDILIKEVIEKTYELDDDSGRCMSIKAIACDSGGKAGVTSKAYDFWRSLRDDKTGKGHHLRFHLVKGITSLTAPRVKLTYPESQKHDKYANARGEIPLLQINSNMVKNQANGMLSRRDTDVIEGDTNKGGAVLFPDWLPLWFYKELTSESCIDGKWQKNGDAANESWDLLCYCIAICVSVYVNVEGIDWNNPPSWAKEWDENDFVFMPSEQSSPFDRVEKLYDLSALGDSLS